MYSCKCGRKNPVHFYEGVYSTCKFCRRDKARAHWQQNPRQPGTRRSDADAKARYRDVQKQAATLIEAKLGFSPRGCEVISPVTSEVIDHCPLYAECQQAIREWRDVACCLSTEEVEALMDTGMEAAA